MRSKHVPAVVYLSGWLTYANTGFICRRTRGTQKNTCTLLLFMGQFLPVVQTTPTNLMFEFLPFRRQWNGQFVGVHGSHPTGYAREMF